MCYFNRLLLLASNKTSLNDVWAACLNSTADSLAFHHEALTGEQLIGGHVFKVCCPEVRLFPPRGFWA